MPHGFGNALRAIDTIWALLSRLLGQRGQARRDVFAEFYRPVYEDLTTVHQGYLDLFDRVRRALPVEGYDGFYLDQSTGWELTSRETMSHIKRARRDLLEARAEAEHIRAKVRAEARGILEAASSEAGQRFLLSIIAYFLEAGWYGLQESQNIDKVISDLLEGRPSLLDTPASRLYEEMGNNDDPVYLSRILREEKVLLTRRYQDVVHHFTRLRIAALG